jgi:hypothetical protein
MPEAEEEKWKDGEGQQGGDVHLAGVWVRPCARQLRMLCARLVGGLEDCDEG